MVANSQPEAAAAPATNATNTTAGAAVISAQKRDVYLTGFGKFGDILENPTTFLAKKLAEHPKVTESHVLEVSKESETIMQGQQSSAMRLTVVWCIAGCEEELAEMYARAEVGYNVADFRIPDERGYVAKDEVIHEDEPGEITTKLPLEDMLKTLQAVHPRVNISTDPGRYICNYVYYRSLVWVKRQEAKGHPEHVALFVHVPEFRNVVFEDQVALASKIVDLVANLKTRRDQPRVASGGLTDPSTHTLHSQTTAMSAQQTKAPEGAELKEAIKRQVEFYFSRANLANDAYLVSQMNSQMYVPVEVIINFSKIKQLTDDTQLLVEAVQDSTVRQSSSWSLAASTSLLVEFVKDAIKPNIKSERTTIILREIPSSTKPEEVEAIFEGCGKVASVRSDVAEAVSTLLALRSKTFNGAAIKAPWAPRTAAAATTASPNMGYYDNYGVQYNTVNPRAGQHHNNYSNGAETADMPATTSVVVLSLAGSFEQRGPGSSRKNKDKRSKAEKQASNSSNGKKAGAAAPSERQPEKDEVSNVITYKYAHEDIMEIVKNMDEKDCTLPEGKMDYAVHPAALTAEAHPDLLRNQRTYSIEQARDAMRQGRPIRSDSVGSIDYESMMYGEDYTKEAREQRKHKAETTPASTDAASAPKPALLRLHQTSYRLAAAVINGTPAPAPEPKKKQPAAKTAPRLPLRRRKERAKAAAAPAVDESLPKTGAWGGRNFLDVVKADPPAAPVKETAAAPASESESK
ncbi:Peptidase C15, pyroglutamyl peptidase I-like [Phytophthora cactorum]|nr:Peptidase C15, pyroglutamyl peptidase I-like [Phytophthora cactorum]